MGRVCILGIFVADTAYRAARMPRMGETILGTGFALNAGGKGSNQAVAAGRAGAEVAFLSRLGDDAFADIADAIWREAGVRFAGPRLRQEKTGAAFIFVDEATGDNAIIVSAGAAGGITPAHVEDWRGEIAAADVFLTQLEQPVDAAMAALRIAREAGVRTILNPAPAAELPDGMLALCDVVTPNESEAEGLTGVAVTDRASAEAAGRDLLHQGAGAALVTLGEAGALWVSAEEVIEVAPMRAGEVVETTGAGDAFNGGLAAAMAEGLPLREALARATAVAAISVTRAGAAPSMPHRADVDALLARG